MRARHTIIIFITLFFASVSNYSAQIKVDVLETIETLGFWAENVIPIASDSNCSSFLIKVKDVVKPHYHAYHTEHIYVLNGSANITLGDSLFKANKGDLIVVPPKTIHSVKVSSLDDFEVISIQSPEYKGEDKIMVE